MPARFGSRRLATPISLCPPAICTLFVGMIRTFRILCTLMLALRAALLFSRHDCSFCALTFRAVNAISFQVQSLAFFTSKFAYVISVRLPPRALLATE